MRSEIERTRLPSFDWNYIIKKLREKSLPEFKCPAASKVPKRFAVFRKGEKEGQRQLADLEFGVQWTLGKATELFT
jgi:hypothetical protein